MRQFFASMSHRSRLAFFAGLLLIAGIIAVAAWWVMHPPFGVLFSNLREADAAEITTALEQMQTPFHLADEGKTILVPAEQVYETRMKLVSQGVPKGGSVGFELFKDSDYGVTEFAQKVNFQRALQGELERTIASLSEVSSARVHLTIQRSSLFEHDQEKSKASVTLDLRPGGHLDAREVAGIQRLVASAVEGLTPEAVVVLDDKGVVLSGYAADGQGGASVSERLDEQAKLEAGLRTRIGQILQRVLQTDDFTVSVDVRLNYDRVKQVRDRLLAQGKDGNGLLVREKVDSTGHGADSSDPDHIKVGPTSNDRELEYAHGQEQEEIDRAPGGIERISVGIVIPSTLPREEIAKLSGVVSAALGLDSSRGDKVDIAAIALPQSAARTAVTAAPAPVHADVVTDVDQAAESSAAPARSVMQIPVWIYVAVGALLLLVLGGLLLPGRQATRRLAASEREETLAQLRQWLESPEARP